MTPPKTYHEGANDERSVMLAKVRREIKKIPDSECLELWIDLEKWILARDERYKKNPGGL